MAEETQKAPMSVRDRAREKALKSRIKSKLIEFEGEKILVTQPTRAAYEGFDEKASAFRKNALIIASCTQICDETGAPIGHLFENGDVDALMQMSPTDALLMELTKAINELADIKSLEAEATKSN